PSAVTATSGFGPLLCPARGRTLWAAVRGRFRRAPGRGLPAGRLSRPGAGLGGGRRQFLTEARRRAGALGEMLPRQAAGALTGAAPPRAGRIAEARRDVGGRGGRPMSGRLRAPAPAPGGRVPQARRECPSG